MADGDGGWRLEEGGWRDGGGEDGGYEPGVRFGRQSPGPRGAREVSCFSGGTGGRECGSVQETGQKRGEDRPKRGEGTLRRSVSVGIDLSLLAILGYHYSALSITRHAASCEGGGERCASSETPFPQKGIAFTSC